MPDSYVLDSFAILALLSGEPGHEQVAALLHRARAGTRLLMSWANVGEIAYIVERRWGAGRVQQVLGMLEETGIEFVALEHELALEAAHLKAIHPLAYADAVAAALALRTKATLVTGDPELRAVEPGVQILWLERPA